MKYIFTLLLGIIFSQLVVAQTEELPLQQNPVLVQKTWEEEQAKEARIKASLVQNINFASERGGGKNIFEDTLYIISGKKVLFTVDTSGQNVDTVWAKNLVPKYGKGSNSYDEVTYSSATGITLGIDTLQVILKFFDKNKKNDTLCYWIVVKRAGKIVMGNNIVLKAEKSTVFCNNVGQLPGKVIKSQLLNLDNYSIAREERVKDKSGDSCIYYMASRLGGDDNVYFWATDIYEVSDTFVNKIKVLQDTLSSSKSETFMDDFAYQDGYPDRVKWLEDRVYINNGMSPMPPTVGVATFDGVNYNGLPYGQGYGVSDVLTSAYLDLSNQKDYYLSFYLQPKGLGYPPRDADSFKVEIKRPNNTWEEVKSIPGIGGNAADAVPPFTFYSIKIGSNYQYKGFQFRFVGKSTRTGVNAIWNLDYVRITQSNPADDNKKPLPFKDLAFANKPPYALKRFTAMPVNQLKGFEVKELYDSTNYKLNSFFENTENVTDSRAVFKETKSGTTIFDDYAYINQLNITPGFSIKKEQFLPKYLSILSTVSSLTSLDELNFVNEYSYKLIAEQEKAYDAVSKNDTVSTVTKCADYYAYDDGTAESIFTAVGGDTQVAVRFSSNKDDVLKAIGFYFPYFNTNASLQKFNLRVFVGSLKTKPDFENIYLSPIYAAGKGAGVLNGFTNYQLLDKNGKPTTLNIPKGDFFIGWQQVSSVVENIPVGFDRNSSKGTSHIFINTKGTWAAAGKSTQGSIMIRPFMGKAQVVAEEEVNTQKMEFSIAPNPSSNVLYINDLEKNNTNYDYVIFSLEGKKINDGQLENEINIENLTNGVYLLRLRDKNNGKASVKKFIVLK